MLNKLKHTLNNLNMGGEVREINSLQRSTLRIRLGSGLIKIKTPSASFKTQVLST